MIANYGLSGFQQPAQRISFGSYEVVDTLDIGANRTHYLARHVMSNETVLLTAIDAALHLPDRISRFVQDMSQVEMMRHPNLATLLTVDVINNRPYFVVSYGAKGTLQQMLAASKTRSLKYKQALALAQELAVAVQYAHDNGFLLGNLAPETVMFAQDGTPLLAEIGLVQALVNAGVPSSTTAVGRRGYLSPERANGKTLSAASDVYALGALLHEMLLGRAPAPADGSGAQLLKGSALSQRLAEVINKSLADDPAERYETPFDFERAIIAISRQPDTTKLFAIARRLAVLAAVAGVIGAAVTWGSSLAKAGVLPDLSVQATTAISTLQTMTASMFETEAAPKPTQTPLERSLSYIEVDISEDPVMTAQPVVAAPAAVAPVAATPIALPTAIAAVQPTEPAPIEALAIKPTAETASVAQPALVDDFLVNPALAIQKPDVAAPQSTPEPLIQPIAEAPVAPQLVATQAPARARRIARKTAPIPAPVKKKTAAVKANSAAIADEPVTAGLQLAVLKTGAERWGRPPEWAAGRTDVCAFINSPTDSGGERLWRFYAQVLLTNNSSSEIRIAPGALSVTGRNNTRIPMCLPGTLVLQPGAKQSIWIRTFFEGDKPAPYRIAAKGATRSTCVQPVTGPTNFAANSLVFKILGCR